MDDISAIYQWFHSGGVFSAYFNGSDRDASEFYRTVESVKPTK